ncbi:hypothetical protein Tco_0584003 [Tanacetum coccineum]
MLCAKVVRELNEQQTISDYINSRLENIDQFLNGFTNQPNEINVDDPKPDDGLDIGEFIVSDMTDVVIGKPFRKVTKLEYDCTKGLSSLGSSITTHSKCPALYLGPEYQVDESMKEWLIRGHASPYEVTYGRVTLNLATSLVIFDEKKPESS